MYVTIDPGEVTGWALWASDGVLAACGLGDPRSSDLHRVETIHDVWIESPRLRPHGEKNPNAILTLARTAGEWGGAYKLLVAEVHYVAPSDWKGQLSKDICHERSWGKLQPAEQAIVAKAGRGMTASTRHNMLDAVAFGLWVSKRAFR